jgi:hypothetical protein
MALKNGFVHALVAVTLCASLTACGDSPCPSNLEGTYRYQDTDYIMILENKTSFQLCPPNKQCQRGKIRYAAQGNESFYEFSGMTIDGQTESITMSALGEFTPTCARTWLGLRIKATRDPDTWFKPIKIE